MRVKKIKINNYDAYIHQTKKYPSIMMSLFFEIPYTKKNIFLSDLLAEYMLYTCKKYKTRKEIYDKTLEVYSPYFSIHNYNRGEKMFTEVLFKFYDPKYAKDEYMDEALDFAKDLLEPNFQNGKLDMEELGRAKEQIISSVGRKLKNKYQKASDSSLKQLFPNTYATIDMIESKEEIEDLINGFKEKDLIDMYNLIFGESLVGMFLMGNIKDEYIEKIRNNFKFDRVKSLETDYNLELKIDETTPYYTKEEDPEYKESILRVIYECPGKTYKDKMVYSVISKMLSSNGMLLHKILRDKYKYVYSTGSYYSKNWGVMSLKAYIDSINEKKTLEAFDEVMDMLKNDALIENLLLQIKEKTDDIVYTMDEQSSSIFDELIDISFDFDVSSKKWQSTIYSITVADIKKGIDKMKKVKIHFYAGVKK